MDFIETGFDGLLFWASPGAYHPDERGSLQELYKAADLPIQFNTFQINHSWSARGVLRGLHYQQPPFAQGKIIHVLKGSIFDVVVDIRAKSPAFGRYFAAEMKDGDRRHLYIPPGFAHGFLAGAQGAVVIYQTDAPYNAAASRALRYDDKTLAVPWPLEGVARLSQADAAAMSWADYLKQPAF